MKKKFVKKTTVRKLVAPKHLLAVENAENYPLMTQTERQCRCMGFVEGFEAARAMILSKFWKPHCWYEFKPKVLREMISKVGEEEDGVREG